MNTDTTLGELRILTAKNPLIKTKRIQHGSDDLIIEWCIHTAITPPIRQLHVLYVFHVMDILLTILCMLT